MTHTLEVAQVGRRLAEKLLQEYSTRHVDKLGGLDPDVVEAACLAHDLGHPPFGHIAEEELQHLLDSGYPYLPDSFEGNAQSFRIVTNLAVHRVNLLDPALSYRGLNLTRATLNAILKYPYQRAPAGDKHRKWGVYETETKEYDWVREPPFSLGDRRSLEAELMDWADDVAYSVHDVEDFYRAGIIPLDRLGVKDSAEQQRFLRRVFERRADEKQPDEHDSDQPSDDDLRHAFTDLMELLYRFFGITEPFDGSRAHRGRLRTLTSVLIGRYINALHLLDAPDNRGRFVRKDTPEGMEVKMLKALTWEYVVNNPALATQQHGQRQLIRTLFRAFHRATRTKEGWKLFPPQYQDDLRRTEREGADARGEKARIVVDLIASMTEHQALRMCQRITGQSPGSVLERV